LGVGGENNPRWPLPLTRFFFSLSLYSSVRRHAVSGQVVVKGARDITEILILSFVFVMLAFKV
jgi:hypothetical protein